MTELKTVDMARICDVSSPAISKAVKSGRLKKNEAGRFDVDDELVKLYLTKHGVNRRDLVDFLSKAGKSKAGKGNVEKSGVKGRGPGEKGGSRSAGKSRPGAGKSQSTADLLSEMDDSELLGIPAELLNMRLVDVLTRFQGLPSLKDFASAIAALMLARKRSIEIAAARGELIEKKFVQTHVMNYLNVLAESLFDHAGEDSGLLRMYEKLIKNAQKSINTDLKRLQKTKQKEAKDYAEDRAD